MGRGMVFLRIETEAGSVGALGRLFERFGCAVVERAPDHLRVGFPDAASESEAVAEARLYLSLRRVSAGSLRLSAA